MSEPRIVTSRGTPVRAVLPAGRYFLGDPGMAMRTGLFQDAVEAMGDVDAALVSVEDAPVAMIRARQATYPNTGLLNRSAYDCDSGRLGIVAESLIIRNMSIIPGSMIRIVCDGRLTIDDGVIHVADDVYPNLVHIDTLRNERVHAVDAARLAA